MGVALSALSSHPIKIYNIRANRPNPGLKRQHLISIESVAHVCNARVKGLHLGSKTIEFFPNKLQGGAFSFDIGTAGSITLVLQACILPSLFAETDTHLVITGGTDVKWSPPWDYFQSIMLSNLKKMGATIKSSLIKRGYYPTGNGKVEVVIHPINKIFTINFEEEIKTVKGIVNIANLPLHIAKRIKYSAENELKKNNIKKSITIEQTTSSSPGVGVVLWTEEKTIGSDILGEKTKPAELIGKEAAARLLKEVHSKVDFDKFAVDQILPYMVLLDEPVEFKCRCLSRHAETEMWLLKKFFNVKFDVYKQDVFNICISKIK
jgi:RNA 3'-phosphate cyclase